MCTAVTYKAADYYFGRNLDIECAYHETVTVTPRNFVFSFRHAEKMTRHYAMIGMAFVVEEYPLYYDATNEKGLSMAGLNFVGNCEYRPVTAGKDNIACFEFVPWILGQCSTVEEVRKLLERVNLTDDAFSEKLPPAQLHWMIADENSAITVECMLDGLHVHENPVGVLTNNPPFEYQMTHLSNFMGLSREAEKNRLAPQLDLKPYSYGTGGLGLPGDLSSGSRFVKAAFTKLLSKSGASESEAISQFFHILNSVAQQRGCVQVEEGLYELTLYSSCCNTDKGIYYYTTYENSQISGVDMHREDLEGSDLINYELIQGQQVQMQN